jgi:hypothetical protein
MKYLFAVIFLMLFLQSASAQDIQIGFKLAPELSMKHFGGVIQKYAPASYGIGTVVNFGK